MKDARSKSGFVALAKLEVPRQTWFCILDVSFPIHSLKSAIDTYVKERPEIVQKKVEEIDLKLAVQIREEDLERKNSGTAENAEIQRLLGENTRLRDEAVQRQAVIDELNQHPRDPVPGVIREWEYMRGYTMQALISVVDPFELSEDQVCDLVKLVNEALKYLRDLQNVRGSTQESNSLIRRVNAGTLIVDMVRGNLNADRIKSGVDSVCGYYGFEYFSLHALTAASKLRDWDLFRYVLREFEDYQHLHTFGKLPHVKAHVDKLKSNAVL